MIQMGECRPAISVSSTSERITASWNRKCKVSRTGNPPNHDMKTINEIGWYTPHDFLTVLIDDICANTADFSPVAGFCATSANLLFEPSL